MDNDRNSSINESPPPRVIYESIRLLELDEIARRHEAEGDHRLRIEILRKTNGEFTYRLLKKKLLDTVDVIEKELVEAEESDHEFGYHALHWIWTEETVDPEHIKFFGTEEEALNAALGDANIYALSPSAGVVGGVRYYK